MEGEDFYTVEEAARVLKLTPGRIRQMLRAGELEGVPPEESGGRGWKIPMHAVHDLGHSYLTHKLSKCARTFTEKDCGLGTLPAILLVRARPASGRGYGGPNQRRHHGRRSPSVLRGRGAARPALMPPARQQKQSYK
jgi:excisionase family DNA binding protein